MMDSLKRFRDFISAPSHTRTISMLVILIIAAAVPLTVLVAQQRQNTQQHAAGPSCIGSKICIAANDLKPTTGCSTCAAGTVCCTALTTPAPTAPPSGPCTKTINGKYVVGGVCSGSYLYTCNGSGGSTGSKFCTYGCQVNSGTYDTCKSAPTVTPAPTPNCPFSCIASNACISANDLQPVSGYRCGSGTVCCKALATPTPTPVSSTCTTNGGSCYKYSCPSTGYTQITGTCGLMTDSACCKPIPTCTGSCQASSSYCNTGSYGPYNSAGNTYCNQSTNGGHPYCCNPKPAPTATPAPTGPCAKTINGKYVIGGVCSGSTLYTCDGAGHSTGSKVCTYGCQVNSGTYDTCKSAPAPTATPAPTTKPTCNATPSNCTACVATPSNACGPTSGTKTCTYTTYNGSTNCNAITKVNLQCQPTCATGTTCNSSNVCVANASPTPTPTTGPTPTGNASPTPSPTPAPGDTVLAFNIGMDAIGSVGDHVNPDASASNKNPNTTNRNLEVLVFNSSNTQVINQIGSINYNSGSGIFTGSVDLGQGFTTGIYTVKVKSDGHLRRIIPGIQTITSGQTVQMPQVNLVAGDVDNNNFININDYNILLSCVSDPDVANVDNHALCNSNSSYFKLSDLDDNGVVDKYDYNLFLREYSVQNGD